MIHPTAKVSQEVNRKCHPRNMIVQLSPPWVPWCTVSQTADKQTDRWQYDDNSQSHCVSVWQVKTLPFSYFTATMSQYFTLAGLKAWNALPEDVTSSQSEYTFHHQLKTWLFKKSFRTSSSDTDCILTFSLGFSVPTLRQFCRLRTVIWYMTSVSQSGLTQRSNKFLLNFYSALLALACWK